MTQPIILISGTGDQPLYDRLWGSGFIPSKYQGRAFRLTDVRGEVVRGILS